MDENFLFKVTQEIENKSSKRIELYPYAQITRNVAPNVTDFYILHEGFIGVFDEQLEEEGYKDIEDKKKEYSAEEGWLGITDKYWFEERGCRGRRRRIFRDYSLCKPDY